MIEFTTDTWNLIQLIIGAGVIVLVVNLVFLNLGRLTDMFRK